MISEQTLFVWIYLPGSHEPVVAGRLTVTPGAHAPLGRFVYGRSYLARQEAIALDPVSLPLRPGELLFTQLGGFPGIVVDCCPDRWGIRVIDRLYGSQPYPAGYILRNDPGRSGALAFSLASDAVPIEQQSRAFTLAELQHAAHAVETNAPADPELLRALHPGTGGARPKCTLRAHGREWIAKFESTDDPALLSIPQVEHATLRLARACGIDAANTALEWVEGKAVCLVERFDRISSAEAGETQTRLNFLSARTVFHADPGYHAVGTGSYQRLARWLPRYSSTSGDRIELFRRLIFNCLVRNTDDHELNHGLIHTARDEYRLAPAYDIVPSFAAHRIHRHALLIGDSAAGTVTNILGIAGAFSLSRDDARALLLDIESRVREQWREVFYEAGFDDRGLRVLEGIFKPLPLSADPA